LNPQANPAANFAWGKAELDNGRSVTIEGLIVQNFVNLATTISVITRTSTDDSDAVLADLAKWVASNFDMDASSVLPTNYLSQAEVILDSSISEGGFSFLNKLATRLTDLLKGYGFSACPPFETTALFLYYDTTKITVPPTLALNFSIDRRAGAAFSENKYFSQAPLKTNDHRAMIEELERLLSR
jgi:hypothetical protein